MLGSMDTSGCTVAESRPMVRDSIAAMGRLAEAHALASEHRSDSECSMLLALAIEHASAHCVDRRALAVAVTVALGLGLGGWTGDVHAGNDPDGSAARQRKVLVRAQSRIHGGEVERLFESAKECVDEMALKRSGRELLRWVLELPPDSAGDVAGDAMARLGLTLDELGRA